MNWEDERFVKLYTRDSVTWNLLRWQGQTVLMHLLRKVDRAGILDLSGESPEDAICAATGLPEDVVSTGLKRLLAKGTVQIPGSDKLVLSNFIEAQEAVKSNSARCKEYRERVRARASQPSQGVSQSVAPDTGRVAPDTKNVAPDTGRHAPTQTTLCDTTRLDETRLEETRTLPSGSSSESGSADVQRVFDHWVSRFWSGKGKRPRLDSKRRARIKARLKGFTADDLCRALSRVDSWYVEQGHTGLQTLLRDDESVERHLGSLRSEPRTSAAGGLPHVSKSDDRIVVARNEGTPTKQLSADEMRKAWRGGCA